MGTLALSTVLLPSCKKHVIEVPENNTPVFVVNGTLGGDEISMTAGDNNAYMHTSVKMVNGVRVFSGNLSDGETSIELGIYDGNIDQPGHVPQVDLSNISLKFAKIPDEPLVVLSKEQLNQYGNIAAVDWYVNGLFEGNNEAYITEPGKYDVCAFVTFAAGETAELCDEIIIGYERSANCSISYQYDYSINQVYVLNANLNATGADIASVEWFLDGEAIPTSTTSLSIPADQDEHLLSARVTFANGVIREKSCVINGGNPALAINDFTVFEMTSNSSLPTNDYTVRLEITKGGRKYRSDLANNEVSSITLLGLEEYDQSVTGNKVYKATIEVKAVVMEVTTEKLHSVVFTTTMAIEVP